MFKLFATVMLGFVLVAPAAAGTVGVYGEVGVQVSDDGRHAYASGQYHRRGYEGSRRCKHKDMRWDPSINMCSTGVVKVDADEYLVPPEQARCKLGSTRTRVERLADGRTRTWTDRCGRLDD
jgi:hypothetical protein